MQIRENVPLAEYTTLRIGGPAKFLAEITNEEELRESLIFAREKKLPYFILGGGSNLLVSDAGYPGLVIRPLLLGKKILETPKPGFGVDEGGSVLIRVGAGEVLDEVIAWTVENGWWGLENLSFIPGLTGALAVQNVGAYGQEAARVIESVEVFDLANLASYIINRESCQFTYRHSRFNTTDKGKFLILRMNLRLSKNGSPNVSYKDLAEEFAGRVPSLAEMREAVIKIRKGKGQDPLNYKSAGSFFSNFKLSKEELEKLLETVGPDRRKELEDLVSKIAAPSDESLIKVPAAWILDRLLGLKGLRVDGAMLSDKQVLNVVNVGGATAADCMELFKKVRKLVYEKTGLLLVNEPELVGFTASELEYYFAL